MRDEKEERKKQARSNKQTRQSNTAHVLVRAPGWRDLLDVYTQEYYSYIPEGVAQGNMNNVGALGYPINPDMYVYTCTCT